MTKEQLRRKALASLKTIKEAWRTLRLLEVDFDEYLLDLDGEMTSEETTFEASVHKAVYELAEAHTIIGILAEGKKDENQF